MDSLYGNSGENVNLSSDRETIIVVDGGGIRVLSVNEVDLDLIKKVVKLDTDAELPAVIVAKNRFPDSAVSIFYNAHSLFFKYPVYLRVHTTAQRFCGPCLICNTDDEGRPYGLTEEQIKTTLNFVQFLPDDVVKPEALDLYGSGKDWESLH